MSHLSGGLAKSVSFGGLAAPSSLEDKSGGSLGEHGLLRWDFLSFTLPGMHILISSQCSLFSQHQCLPAKGLNSA